MATHPADKLIWMVKGVFWLVAFVVLNVLRLLTFGRWPVNCANCGRITFRPVRCAECGRRFCRDCAYPAHASFGPICRLCDYDNYF